MRAVGFKVLKNKLSEYVRLAARGETILVTDRDRVVAELRPPDERRSPLLADAMLAELVRNGLVRPPLSPPGTVPPRAPVAPTEELLRELATDREDRWSTSTDERMSEAARRIGFALYEWRLRCFVAIDVSSRVRDALAEAQAGLRADAPGADVRWVDPAQLHLTLQFLGQVPDAQAAEIAARLATVAAGRPAIELAAVGLGAFPTLRRARVVWAGLTGGVADLAVLAREVGTALEPLGFVPETRPFRAHVTLGRVRSPRGLGRLARALERAGDVDLGSWTAGDMVLYQSRLKPTGAVYEAIARAPLRGEMRWK